MGFLVTAGGKTFSVWRGRGKMLSFSFYAFSSMIVGFLMLGNIGIKSWIWFTDGKWIDIPFSTILYYLFGEQHINSMYSNKFEGYNIIINYILTSESWIVLSLISIIILVFFNPIFKHNEEKYTRKENESLEDFVKRMDE